MTAFSSPALALLLALLALGLDLMVPPLSILALLWAALFAVSVAFSWWWGLDTALWLSAGNVGVIGGALFLAWLRFGRDTVSPLALISIPFYVLWKLPLYAGLLLRGRQKTWERTERASGSKREASGR